MLEWLSTLKDLLSMDSAKRSMLIGYMLLISAIWYLYDRNLRLQEIVDAGLEKEREVVKRQREICDEQLSLNRSRYQEQFTEFVILSNRAIESMNNDNLEKAKAYMKKIDEINSELILLKKNENNGRDTADTGIAQ